MPLDDQTRQAIDTGDIDVLDPTCLQITEDR